MVVAFYSRNIGHEHLTLQVVMYAFVLRQLSGRGCASRDVLCVAACEAGRGWESRDVLRVAACEAWYLLLFVFRLLMIS